VSDPNLEAHEMTAHRQHPQDDRPIHPEPALATVGVHGGLPPEAVTGAILPPIFQTTTFVQEGVGGSPGSGAGNAYTYSRAHNPTVTALETALAAFEGLPHARAFATGMAAITTLALAALDGGGHVVCSDVVYGGTVRLLDRVLAPLGVAVSYVDTADAEAVAAALRDETKLVLVETPANPTLKLTDLAAVAAATRHHPALLAVDNTFLTAALQRPAEHGADVVVYSTTKYVEGHNSTLGGALALSDRRLLERVDLVRKTTGSIQSPLQAWLTLKGLKTLTLRMERHAASAAEIADWLAGRREVANVHYPFHRSFAQRELALRQQAAGGGIVSFELVGGVAAAERFCAALRLCRLAETLGATETLVTHPATMTHGDVPAERRRATGIGDGLIRLSVGLEAPRDLVADLDAALTACQREVAR